MLKDFRYALRMLRKNPAFAIVAVCSLAIGIGATSAIYSLAYAMLLRPLPVPKPSRVVTLKPHSEGLFNAFSSISYPDYVDFRDRNRTFDGIVGDAYSYFGFAADPTSLPRMKFGMFASGNFFRVLGVEPVLGRGFRDDEDRVPGRDAVVVLGHDFWVSEYHSDPSITGKKIRLNGVDFTIIGVAPESFTGTDQFIRPALYVPFAMAARMGNAGDLNRRDVRWVDAKGRLKPGVSLAQAQADIGAIANALRTMYPKADANLQIKVESQLQFQAEMSPPDTALMIMLGVLAVCVLLVTCANVAGLLLSRSGARAREIAVRLAIGAGRTLLVRQLLIENLLIALGGGAAGLFIAYLAVKIFNTMPPPPTDMPLNLDIGLNPTVLLVAAAASILSVFLFGLAPALRTTRPNLVPALRALDTANSRAGRLWGRNLLVGAQIAVSLVLLIVSGVMVEGFRAQLAQGPGFRTDHLYVMSFDAHLLHYTDAQQAQFYKQLIDRTRSAPDVKTAALASMIPMSMNGSAIGVVPEGYQLKRGVDAIQNFDNVVSDGYFETMGIPIVEGRPFLETDKANTPAVAIVNEKFAAHYWPHQNPIGKRFHMRSASGPLVEIVGVAKMSKYVWISEAPFDFIYLPFSQNPQAQMTLVAQSKSPDASALAPVLRRVVATIDRNMPVFDARTMKDLYQNRAVKTPNMISGLVAVLGIMGLVLAVVGLYGLIAYSVSRRTREIGIRMAIGADRPKVLAMILWQGFKLGIAGVCVGILLGVLASRAMQATMLLTFSGMSILPFAVVSLLLIAITMAATYVPARRASLIDPMRALRDE